MDPYSSPYITHYSSSHVLFHSLIFQLTKYPKVRSRRAGLSSGITSLLSRRDKGGGGVAMVGCEVP